MRSEERAVRLVRLWEYLNSQERPVPVSELSDLVRREYGVSEVTLRSDLAALCSLRSIHKVGRGMYEAAPDGARSGLLGSGLFTTRLARRAEEKLAIAGATASLLAAQPDLRVLLLDGGTTTFFVADRLAEHRGLDLLVWTPNVAAAARLAGSRGTSVRLLGGEYHPDYAVVYGDETVRALRTLAAPGTDETQPLPQFPGTHCVLDVSLVGEDGGLYTDESAERLQKRLMVDLAEDLTVVADSSKLFRRRLGLQPHTITFLRDLSGKRSVRLVTDLSVPADQRGKAAELLRTARPGSKATVCECNGALVVESTGVQV